MFHAFHHLNCSLKIFPQNFMNNRFQIVDSGGDYFEKFAMLI